MNDDTTTTYEQYAAKKAVADLFVEFLRAISALDFSHRSRKVDYSFWAMISAVSELDGDERGNVVFAAIDEALRKGRDEQENDIPDAASYYYSATAAAKSEVVNASAKVIAERISSVTVQLHRAESNVSDAINRLEYERTKLEYERNMGRY